MPTPSQEEYLDIDGVALAIDGAWEWLDLSPLWEGADKRGSDRLVPGATGVVPYPRRATVSRRAINGYIYGFKDYNGVAFSDVRVGLEANIAFLQENIEEPPNPLGDGTRLATLHLPSGATKTGDVHVEKLRIAAFGPAAAKAVLELSIPSGALVYAGS